MCGYNDLAKKIRVLLFLSYEKTELQKWKKLRYRLPFFWMITKKKLKNKCKNNKNSNVYVYLSI